MASYSSSSRDWVYDVFVSFRGEDVRSRTILSKLLSHFRKELDRKLIKTFMDERIEKGQSLDPLLKEAIRTSRIAVVVFSENYASSSWCLDELVEIVKCKEELDLVVIPIFFGLDPSHVRKQTGKFGEVFAKTCQKKSKDEVANLCGNHPQNWPTDANMSEEIAKDVSDKKLDLIPQNEFENFVGMASSSSSSRNWVYDVFVNFRGKDVREKFLSHFLKELERKDIKTFIDNKMEKGESIDPVLKQAIRTSRIAVVVFSENYASSSWCLDELVEIVKCKEELDQVVIPIFYGLDPCHVRHQIGKFGEVFAKTCEKKSENPQNWYQFGKFREAFAKIFQKKSENEKLWRESLIKVANLCGNHPPNWSNEAQMVEEIANDILGKVLKLTPRKEFENFVGMEDHIAIMNILLHLESEEVRMVGMWGSSGLGKTSIARALHSGLSQRFQFSIFIDKAFISNVMKMFEYADLHDPKMKFHLVRSFLSEILDNKDIKIGSSDAVKEMLKHYKVLIFIDDLDHQVVLDTLVGQTEWFGCGSRIIVITKDVRFLRAHGIIHIYKVCRPSDELSRKIFQKIGKYSPHDGLMDFASEIALRTGDLSLCLHALDSYVRGIEKEKLIDMLTDSGNGLNADIEKTLRLNYDGSNNPKNKAIISHTACLFNSERVRDIRLLLADRNLNVNIGLKNLVNKSLKHIRNNKIEMQSLLQKNG